MKLRWSWLSILQNHCQFLPPSTAIFSSPLPTSYRYRCKPPRAPTATIAMATLASVTWLVLLLAAWQSHALLVNSNSPCQSLCNAGGAATTADSVVCLDSDYSSTDSGSHFQQCVECELASNAANPSTGTTDVMWGLCQGLGTHSSDLAHSLTWSR